MSYQENCNNLDPILLRAEQSFFEKDEKEINQYEQRIKTDQEKYEQRIKTDQEKYEQSIQIHQHHNKDKENTIQLLKLQLLQAQEEIGLSNQRMSQSLQQVKDFELQSLQQAKDFKLQSKQLNQAQEELSAALDSMRSLQEWQYIHRTSIISQLKLIVKTLARKLRNKAVWLIPLHGARKCKTFLKRFIQSKT